MLVLLRVGRWELTIHNDHRPADDPEQVVDMPQPAVIYTDDYVGFVPEDER